MAYNETGVLDVGRLATYDTLVKEHIETRIADSKVNANLLRNWYFVNPVNRASKTSYSGGNGYHPSIDGWLLCNGTLNVNDDYVSLTANETDCFIQQSIDLGSFKGDEILTFSALVSPESNVQGAVRIIVFEGTETSVADIVGNSVLSGITSATVNLAKYPNANRLGVRLMNNTAGKHTDYISTKLEVGDVSTLSEDEIAVYAEQYAICSQYSSSADIWTGNQHSNTNMLDNWYFKNPVNRQNFTDAVVGETWSYFIDRWFAVRANVSLSSNGLSVNVIDNPSMAFCSLTQRIRYNYFNAEYTISAIIDGELYSETLVSPDGSNQYIYNNSTYKNGIAFGLQSFNNGYLGVYVYIQSTTPVVISAIKCELGATQTLARKDDNGAWILIDPPSNYETEYVKCVQYDVNTGDYIGLNAKSVNALSVEGGIVNGDIVVETESAAKMAVRNVSNATEAQVTTADNGAQLVAGAIDDENNKATLTLNRETSNLNEAVQLERVIDGESTVYNLYGEHNKPTAADIGAATESGLDEVKTTIETNYDESIIGLSVSGTTVTYIKGDGSVHTFETQDTNTTYSLGTDQETGLTKLYATVGSAEDGTMTQKAIKTELDKKVGVRLNNNTLVFTI